MPSFLIAQDYFPAFIPEADFAVEVESFAVLPDSFQNAPARVSVITADPAGRLFVNDQRGPLYHLSAEGQAVSLYLDLRDYAPLGLVSGGERGFQGFAFHPDFHDPSRAGYGRLYTIHSSADNSRGPDFSLGRENNLRTLLIEWRTGDSGAVPFVPLDEAEPWRELIRFNQPYNNHNAGNVAFKALARPGEAAYGALYVALGDGGAGGDPLEAAENPGTPFGAILRLDPLGSNSANGRYGIVAGNALAKDGDPATLGEIYAYGLRNPQRFGWDAVTGELYIADIGQNAVEEINRALNGGNFGWDAREGSFSFEAAQLPPGLIDPVAEYDHTRPVANPPTGIANRAITVGEVVRGGRVTGLEGHLLLGDFPTGAIFVLDVDMDPLEGGQDGLRLLPLRVRDGAMWREVSLMGLINEERARRGLSMASRADLRFSLNTQGRLFLTNKQDGIIRRIVPDQAAELRLATVDEEVVLITNGHLEESEDLWRWQSVRPQPKAGSARSLTEDTRFYRLQPLD